MSKNKEQIIDLVEYVLLGDLHDEEDCLNSFVNDYDSGYICDVISEVADNFIPIYTDDIWNSAKDIKEYIAEAQAQGLCEGETDIEKIMISGFYIFYTQTLSDNLSRMAYNVIAEKVNDYLNELSEEDIDLLSINSIEEMVDEKAEEIDSNDQYSVMEDYADYIIEEIKEMLLEAKEDDEDEE